MTRLIVATAILLQFAITTLIAEEIQEGEGDPPVKARLIVKTKKYILPKDRHGEAFRKRIIEETDTDNLPLPPRIDLVLELTNITNEDVVIWPYGSIQEPELIVEGKGIVEPENLMTFEGRGSGTNVQPTIKPGKSHGVPIKSLNPQGGTPFVFWNEPGEYSIKAKYAVYTGLPSFPFGGDKKPTGKPKRYKIETELVTVQVVVEEPQRPLIVAHRGLLHHAPENTLANFRACLELRLGFEFDVQQAYDGQLICIHDDTVDRTTDGVGHVLEMTLDEIRKLDAGRWFDARFAGEKVPTVDEVFQLIAKYRQQDILVAVDFKAQGVEADVAKLAEKRGVLDRLLFIGTPISESSMREDIKAVSKQAQTAVVASDAEEFPFALKATAGDWIYFRYLPSEKQIKAVHEAGKRAFIAGSAVSGNLPDNWRRAATVGIDAVLTDYPLEMRKALKAKE